MLTAHVDALGDVHHPIAADNDAAMPRPICDLENDDVASLRTHDRNPTRGERTLVTADNFRDRVVVFRARVLFREVREVRDSELLRLDVPDESPTVERERPAPFVRVLQPRERLAPFRENHQTKSPLLFVGV
jgi:hypothetical protein